MVEVEQDPNEAPTEGESDLAPGLVRWTAPLYEDVMLWPILIALVGHFVIALGPLLIKVMERSSLAIFLLVVSLVASGKVVQVEWGHTQRASRLTWTLVVTWLLGALTAWAGKTWDLL